MQRTQTLALQQSMIADEISFANQKLAMAREPSLPVATSPSDNEHPLSRQGTLKPPTLDGKSRASVSQKQSKQDAKTEKADAVTNADRVSSMDVTSQIFNKMMRQTGSSHFSFDKKKLSLVSMQTVDHQRSIVIKEVAQGVSF